MTQPRRISWFQDRWLLAASWKMLFGATLLALGTLFGPPSVQAQSPARAYEAGAAASPIDSPRIVFSATKEPSSFSCKNTRCSGPEEFGFWISCTAPSSTSLGNCRGSMFFYNIAPIAVPVTGTATLTGSTAKIKVSSPTTAAMAVACTLENNSFFSGPRNTVSVTCDALSWTKPGPSGASTTKADAIVLINNLHNEISSPPPSASVSPNGPAPNLLDYNGGAVLKNPEIHNVYMDSNWDADNPGAISMANIDGFTGNLATSAYLNSASQYGVGAATFTGSNGPNILCPSPIIGGITDFVAISAWMQCMTAPSPIPFTGTVGGVPVPDNNTVYAVYVPTGTQINDLVKISCVDYIAYHFFGATTVWAGTIFTPFLLPQSFVYTMVPVQCATQVQQNNSLPGLLDGVTYPATHEIIEASTDPVVLAGWVDNTTAGGIPNILLHGEAADICLDKGVPPMQLANGTFVAPYWSNADNACVPAPSLSLSNNPIPFGNQTVFTISGSMDEFITNNGNATLNLGGIFISGDADFFVAFDGCSLQTIQVGNSCVVAVRFNPHSVGPGNATLNIPSNTPSGTATVGITGNAVKANTSSALVSSPNPSVFGQSVTLTATVTSGTTGSATGTVTFKDCFGHPFCIYLPIGTSPVIGGVATLAFSAAAAVGNHSIEAQYSGDANFTPSFKFMVQTVNKDASVTILSSSKNPSAVGTAVTFTAAVSAAPPGSGTPSGTVTFKDGATLLGSVALSAGKAALTTSTLALGSHSITATYGGDGNFNGSGGALTQAVDKTTTTSVASSVNPSVFGEAVKFTATVTPSTATGMVTFRAGALVLGTGPVALGKATLSTSTLGVGAHAITATYNGDAAFLASTSAVLSQTVNKAPTKTTLTSSVDPSVFGEAVKFTATVTAVAPGAGTPTGTVTFKDGLTTLGSGALSISGVATFTTSALAVGAHSITATYDVSIDYNTSTSAVLTQTVNKAATSTSVASSVNPSAFGQSVTFTATVKSSTSGTPTGTVTFKDGATTLGTGVLSSGKATLATSTLALGTHSITAIYSGSATFLASTSPAWTQTVEMATSTSVASSVNPSAFGQSVTFTATVKSSTSGTPTGTVTFKDGATTLGTGVLSSGKATLATSTLALGTHSITAIYSGSPTFQASTSPVVTQMVNPAATSTLLTSSLNPSTFGSSVTFTVTVKSSTSGTPTGTVKLTAKQGITSVTFTATLSGGKATATTLALPRGTYSITAMYGGSITYLSSTSAVLTQTVN